MTSIEFLCAGAARSAFGHFPDDFSRSSGVPIKFSMGPAGGLLKSLRGGAPADVVVLSSETMNEAIQHKLVDADSVRVVGSVGFAIGVAKGGRKPSIGTADEFRAALVSCQSFCYADPATGDSSGLHMASVIQKLGIEAEVSAKQVLRPLGVAVADALEAGAAEFGALQTSIVLARPRLQLVGTLPQEFQKATTYCLALTPEASGAAGSLFAYLDTAAARANFRAAGFVI